jgi:uncharacterized Tic20 family protein
MIMTNTPDEQSEPQPFVPEDTGTVTQAADAEPAPTAPVEPEPVDAEIVDAEPVEPEIVDAEIVDAEPVESETVDAEAVAEPEPGIVDAEPVAQDVPAPAEATALSLDDAEPAAPQAPDLDAVDPTPRLPGQATNLDLPSLELPHPAPEPAAPAVPPPAPSFPAGGDYTQNLAQSAYGQPTPQPSPQPAPQPTPPPYAGAPYAAPTPPQYSQPAFGQEPYGQPGYGQPAYNQLVPATQLSPTDEGTWATAAHWSSILGGLVSLPFLGPLLVLLIQGPKSPRVRANAVESLNFDITMTIAMLISFVLIVVAIGVLTTPVLGILWLVMKIVAAVQTNNGQDYRYPVNIRLVK